MNTPWQGMRDWVKSPISPPPPAWAASPDTAEPGRIRPSGVGGGTGGRQDGGNSLGDPRPAGKVAPRGAAVPGGVKFGGVSSKEVGNHWDLHRIPSLARMAQHMHPSWGSWTDPPWLQPQASGCGGARGWGDPSWEKPIPGKETLSKSIPSAAGACQTAMPEISQELHAHPVIPFQRCY